MVHRRVGAGAVSTASPDWESPERSPLDRLQKMSADMTIGFVGLGAMGQHMAARLLDAGHELAVFDTRPEAVEPHAARGARACDSAAAVADVAGTVLVSLPTPDVVRTVATGDRGLLGGEAMRTYVDLSTTGPVVAAEVAARLGEGGVACLDAPVSGGVAGAQAGTLTVMAAGDARLFQTTRPLLEALGGNVVHVGEEPGQGQLAKVLNNLLSATAIAITSEALALGVRGGLSARTLVDVFNSSSGRNTATADKFPRHVLPRTFGAGFRMELMNKDVQLCLAEAQRRGVPMVLGGSVGQLWSLAEATANDGADCTEIVQMVERWARVVIADD
jgi:3-hydroxyisobutyrate dehydrogenase-like beta-hydroxyacid dehydrogenase